MMLEFTAWLFGLLSAGIFAYLALRASLLHRRAERVAGRVASSPPSAARDFFDRFSQRLKVEAGWRPMDHGLIIIAIMALSINQLLNGIKLFV
ncbi:MULTISPECIES: hypothetical protein [Halomonadaceae]|uniref:hypothetical protein n=1 Tax=Halomonadaceae TaxID=28256 RepID=UPI0015989A05|nr:MULTISPECIES: hypothetical protein [Halomonas]QJQ96032.1 hypothetical protein HIO72_12635 [Halomonas sp. PA5]